MQRVGFVFPAKQSTVGRDEVPLPRFADQPFLVSASPVFGKVRRQHQIQLGGRLARFFPVGRFKVRRRSSRFTAEFLGEQLQSLIFGGRSRPSRQDKPFAGKVVGEPSQFRCFTKVRWQPILYLV